MRQQKLTLDQAMRHCVHNDQVTAILAIPGGYAIDWSYHGHCSTGEVFATTAEVRAAVQAASGDYYEAAKQLRAAYAERKGNQT
jgi:hypothetical protein